jgi:ParB-like chromosome segregation protein Spo0J
MKITRENLKNIVREAMVEESAYQEFFKKALEKTGKSIPEMSEEEKKAFFNKIDKSWNGKGEKKEIVETELEEAQSPAQKAAFAKMLAKKDGKDESTDDEKEEVKESIIKEGFVMWEMSFADMNLNGVKLSKKNKYKVKARNTVEAIKKAASMAGLKGQDWVATQTNYLKKIG